nr:hypothetical protein [Tanacetum cinerariifolium]
MDEEGWCLRTRSDLLLKVYKMDVKSVFLNGKISEEVYVEQSPRYQANPKESHLVVVKRIFKYLKGTQNLGLWYPKGSGFDFKAYLDSNYAGCNLDRKTEAEYVTVAGCYAQVLWIKSQLADYDVLYDKVPIFCDNTSAIAISNNPVLHSKTKHIDIREVNVDDTADKSLSRASEQPVTQLKATTDLKKKKKKIPSSSQLKSPHKVTVILPMRQVADTQHAEVTVP